MVDTSEKVESVGKGSDFYKYWGKHERKVEQVCHFCGSHLGIKIYDNDYVKGLMSIHDENVKRMKELKDERDLYYNAYQDIVSEVEDVFREKGKEVSVVRGEIYNKEY